MHVIFFPDGYLPPEIRGKEIKEVKELNSRHSPEDSLELLFYLKTQGDLEETALRLARDETTGKWIGKGEPTSLFKKSMADVDKIFILEKGEGIVSIRTPLINISPEDPLYQILMLAVGGPVLEFVYYERVTLLDINLPPSLLKRFPGPSFGIFGVRELLNLPPSHPILGTIIKPCAGLTPEEVADKCYQAVKGGVRFIKDDEKMLGPAYAPPEKKIKLVSQALQKAYEETGVKCIYAPHLVGRADKLVDIARRYIEWGATGLMLNVVLGHTPEVLKILREHPEINVPLYAHSGGRSGLSTGPRRIEDGVIVKLIRLCGGDFFQHGVFGVRDCHVASLDENLLHHLVYTMRQEIPGIKDTIPVAAGGLGKETLKRNLTEHYHPQFGYGVALLAGTGLLGDPEGPESGGRKMREIIEEFLTS